MGEKIVVFAEEDPLFRLMETSLNGRPSPKGLEALEYIFGKDLERQLNRLVSLPALVGLPQGLRGVVCDEEGDLGSLMSNADYVVVERKQISRDLMECGRSRLEFIQKFGSDWRNIDVKAAEDLGVSVSSLRRMSSIFVGEYVLGMIYALSRSLMLNHEIVRDRVNARDKMSSGSSPRTKFNWGEVQEIGLVQGKTLGLVGFGETGFEAALAASRARMKIAYYQRNRSAQERERRVGARYVSSLHELAREADFISIHTPYVPSTEKMFNLEVIASMRPSSFLINTSQGGVVDEDALFEALKEKRIAGAALDVYRFEPVPPDCPLLELRNVIWTTHNAAGTSDSLVKEQHDVLANIARVANGKKPRALVNAA